MSRTYPVDNRNKVKRVPGRGHYDKETVYEILDCGEIAHVSFVMDGQPFIIPTLYGRKDNAVYIHGSAASRMLKTLVKGVPCSMAVTLVDGLVLARSAFHHSMNYRSVVLYGNAALVSDEHKEEGLQIISEHIIPGRWEESRKPEPKELKGTTVLRMDIDQASAKIRTGGPVDEERDYDLPVWAGTIPITRKAGEPIPDPLAKYDQPVPESVANYLEHYRRMNE